MQALLMQAQLMPPQLMPDINVYFVDEDAVYCKSDENLYQSCRLCPKLEEKCSNVKVDSKCVCENIYIKNPETLLPEGGPDCSFGYCYVSKYIQP